MTNSGQQPADQPHRSAVVLLHTVAERVPAGVERVPGTAVPELEVHPPAVLQLGEQLNLSVGRSEEHTSELQSRGHLVCRLLLEKKKQIATRSFACITW